MGRGVSIPTEDRLTRATFGIIMILSAFVSWGKWVVVVLGFLFLFSAWQGICVTCAVYKKMLTKNTKK